MPKKSNLIKTLKSLAEQIYLIMQILQRQPLIKSVLKFVPLERFTLIKLHVGYAGMLSGICLFHWERGAFQVYYRDSLGRLRVKRCRYSFDEGLQYPAWQNLCDKDRVDVNDADFPPRGVFFVRLIGSVTDNIHRRTTNGTDWTVMVHEVLEFTELPGLP